MKRLFAATVIVAIAAIGVPLATATAATAAGGNSTNAKACQKGGWQNFVRTDGTTFSSETACVSYAAKGGTLTTPKTASQVDCESLGGTFTGPEPGNSLWTCNSWTYATSTDYQFGMDTLTADCVTDGGIDLLIIPVQGGANGYCLVPS